MKGGGVVALQVGNEQPPPSPMPIILGCCGALLEYPAFGALAQDELICKGDLPVGVMNPPLLARRRRRPTSSLPLDLLAQIGRMAPFAQSGPSSGIGWASPLSSVR